MPQVRTSQEFDNWLLRLIVPPPVSAATALPIREKFEQQLEDLRTRAERSGHVGNDVFRKTIDECKKEIDGIYDKTGKGGYSDHSLIEEVKAVYRKLDEIERCLDPNNHNPHGLKEWSVRKPFDGQLSKIVTFTQYGDGRGPIINYMETEPPKRSSNRTWGLERTTVRDEHPGIYTVHQERGAYGERRFEIEIAQRFKGTLKVKIGDTEYEIQADSKVENPLTEFGVDSSKVVSELLLLGKMRLRPKIEPSQSNSNPNIIQKSDPKLQGVSPDRNELEKTIADLKDELKKAAEELAGIKKQLDTLKAELKVKLPTDDPKKELQALADRLDELKKEFDGIKKPLIGPKESMDPGVLSKIVDTTAYLRKQGFIWNRSESAFHKVLAPQQTFLAVRFNSTGDPEFRVGTHQGFYLQKDSEEGMKYTPVKDWKTRSVQVKKEGGDFEALSTLGERYDNYDPIFDGLGTALESLSVFIETGKPAEPPSKAEIEHQKKMEELRDTLINGEPKFKFDAKHGFYFAPNEDKADLRDFYLEIKLYRAPGSKPTYKFGSYGNKNAALLTDGAKTHIEIPPRPLFISAGPFTFENSKSIRNREILTTGEQTNLDAILNNESHPNHKSFSPFLKPLVVIENKLYPKPEAKK